MGKEIATQIQEAQRVPGRINPRRKPPIHTVIKLTKIKHNNIRIIGVPEGEEREKGPEKIFEEIIVKNFPNMGKEIATQVQEVQRVPYRINPR